MSSLAGSVPYPRDQAHKMLFLKRFYRKDDFFFICGNMKFVAIVWQEERRARNRSPVSDFPPRQIHFPDVGNRDATRLFSIENVNRVVVDIEVRIFWNDVVCVHRLRFEK